MSGETKHEWRVKRIDYPRGRDVSFEIVAGKELVAQTIMREIGEGWRNDIIAADYANMTLMAAAREMLAALRAAIEISDSRIDPYLGRTDECQAVYDQCAAAISKAESRP